MSRISEIEIFEAARSLAEKRHIRLSEMIVVALGEYVERETAQACNSCGSLNIFSDEGDFETGVVAPDGGREYRYERWIQCRDCGARDEWK